MISYLLAPVMQQQRTRESITPTSYVSIYTTKEESITIDC